MKASASFDPQDSSPCPNPQDKGPSLWERLKSKNVCYLTIPLLVMATVTEFVILATGWKYQQKACLPPGMGVTFFNIGPIGATILAVELLKLPLAIWTASRRGWAKGFMLIVGLPLMCLLTFQLVKDMAVYEMGVAMKPAGELLVKASEEEVRIVQLQGELAAIETKKANRQQTLAELETRKAKAKADLEELLRHNSDSRQDAVSLTDYQKKALSEVEARQAVIIKQFDADTEKLTKATAELRTRRDTELSRATTWNAEEARLENAYKAKMTTYANEKAAYEKAKAEYENANVLKRTLMRKPVDPGVSPVREVNKILKPAELAQIDEQIQTKEAELLTVNNKRRERVAQVEDDARRVREEFDRRSTTKRDEADRKREEFLAAQVALDAQLTAEVKQVDQEYQAAAQKVDGIRAEMDACRKRAESHYEAREESIKNTQVHRIATTVEIVRGLFLGKHPISITATAKERGDLYTDQISMVRIWVYPVLAFLVAFLPTLMVEIGFSTLFMPPQEKPVHRLGFFGRGLHQLYIRAGRQKILRAERMASEVTAQITARDKALAQAQVNLEQVLADAKAQADRTLAQKDAELQSTRDALAVAQARNDQRSKQMEAEHAAELKNSEEQWVSKLATMADSLNRAIVEKDALRDLQRSEVERQVQMRQNAWSERLNQLSQDLDAERASAEAERTAMLQEHHRKLMEVSEDAKTQVAQARRQIAGAELAAVESTATLAHDLKAALNERDAAVAQLQQQTEALTLKLSQATEDAAREMEKTARQEKHRWELQQLEFAKTLRQREEDYDHQLKQREQELALALEARLMEEKHKVEQESRRREAELESHLQARALEVEARWNQELKQRDEVAQLRLKQREQQLQSQTELRLRDSQAQAEQESRRQKLESERQIEAQAREASARMSEAVQQQELAFHNKLKQREQELIAKAIAQETELQGQWTADLREREEAWEQQTEARVRATEARLNHDAQQKEAILQMSIRQREQELQAQFDARMAELKGQWDQSMREQEQSWENDTQNRVRATESRWTTELQQKDELFQSKLRQHDQQWQGRLDATRAELQAQQEQALRRREAEANASQHELEARLRTEMQQKGEAAQAEASQRQQELTARMKAQLEAQVVAAEAGWQKIWHSEAEEKIRVATSSLKVQLARSEKERDEARESAAAALSRVQEMEEQMSEATSFLSRRRDGNGKNLVLVAESRH